MTHTIAKRALYTVALLLANACGGGGVSVDTAYDRQAQAAIDLADDVSVSFAMQQNTTTTDLATPTQNINLAGIHVTSVVVYYKAFGFETTSPLHCNEFTRAAVTAARVSQAPECRSSDTVTSLTVPSFRKRDLLAPRQESVFLPAVTSQTGYLQLGSPGTAPTDWVLQALGSLEDTAGAQPITITTYSELSLQFASQSVTLVSDKGLTFLLGADQLFAPITEQVRACLTNPDVQHPGLCHVSYSATTTEAFAGDITTTE